jgi:glycosyltransferase involved in cell wall biosynthesis
MRIASLTNTALDPGLGSGKTVLAWAQGFRDLGHEVDVFPPETYYRPWLGDKGRRLKMRLDALRLGKVLLTGGYDLVEFYGAEFGRLIDRLARVPRNRRPLLVAHTNGLELLARNVPASGGEMMQPPGVQRWMAHLVEPLIARWDVRAFSRVDAFSAICQADADHVMSQGLQPAERCAVVEPGIDEIYLHAPWQRPKQPWLVSLGSWTDRKDPATTVRVVSSLLAQNPQLVFHVLGAGGARGAILAAFTESVRNRVFVHPRLPESGMADMLSQAKVLLFPSLYEGFGMATTEAMACGCTVVVTPTGFGSCIQDGVDGYVCGYRDAEAMTARCQALLSDDALRQRMATTGRARVEGMTWKHQTAALDAIYRGWLGTL